MDNAKQMTPSPLYYRWVLLAGVWSLYAVFGLVVTSLAPLVKLIEADLAMTHVQMGTTMGAWQLVFIGSAVPCGILLDKLGPRRALAIGGVLIGASVLARAYATDFTELLLAVMLFGLGGPIVSAGAPKVVTTWFEGSARGLAMGIYMTGPAIGGMVSLTMTHSVLLPALDGSWRQVMVLWGCVAMVVSLLWLVAASAGQSGERDGKAGVTGLPQTHLIRRLVRQPAVVLVLMMSIGVLKFPARFDGDHFS